MRTLSTVLASACASLAVFVAGCSDPTRPTESATPSASVATAGTGGSLSIESKLAPGKCVDVRGADKGADVVISTCDDASSQRLVLTANDELRTADGRMCVDAAGGEGNDRDRVIVWPCHGGANQKWSVTADGEITGINGKCLDVYGFRTEDGARLIIYGCHGGDNQLWDVQGGPAPEEEPTPLPVPSTPGSSKRPSLPQRFFDTDYVRPTGRSIRVAAGDDLQEAINAARPGDEIVLQAGATFIGNFRLPKKDGDGWVTIRASDDAGVPEAGVRMTPAAASRLPKLLSNNHTTALYTKPGAHHYRIVGLEIGTISSLDWSYGLVAISSGYDDAVSDYASNIIIDRSYIHGHAELDVKRCVEMNGTMNAVIDSYLAGCHADRQDSQAIAGWNGPGPYKIVNNYLEGAAENVIFGGNDPRVANTVPSDIEIRGNHFFKPVSWRDRWMVKNLLELKNAQRVLIEGNVFENNWLDGQTGFGFVFWSVNQSGRCNWCVTQDVTMRYNIVKNVAGGFQLTDRASWAEARGMQRVAIEHNILLGVGASELGNNGRLYQIAGGIRDLRIQHNTGFGATHSFIFDVRKGVPASGIMIRDNITGGSRYQLFNSGGQGSTALKIYMGPDYDFAGNIVVGALSKIMPSGNYYPGSIEDVSFVDYGDDVRLSSGSPFKGRATDGTDPGADVAEVLSKTARAVRN